MITIHLMGGLGNQLFQIALTIAYALDNGYEFRFLYSKTLTTGITRSTYWDNILKSLKPYTRESIPRLRMISESHFSYNDIPKQLDDIMFFGYYQSYKYFDHRFKDIEKIFKLDEYKSLVLNKSRDIIPIGNTVSLHFRLGDYKVKQECHPILNYKYYENALYNIQNYTNKPDWTILYFGENNDIDNVLIIDIIQKLETKFPTFIFQRVSDDFTDSEQLILMSLCTHNIIANSTFSWWAAYLNKNPNKLVYYSNTWFGPSVNYDSLKDLFPPKWIRIM